VHGNLNLANYKCFDKTKMIPITTKKKSMTKQKTYNKFKGED
jgi:hypothetical protein